MRLDRSFAGKVHAFNAGYEKVKGLEYDVIGNLDADISFEKDHFEFLLTKFSEDPRLGVAGTVFQGGRLQLRQQTASRDRSTFRGSARSSGGSAGRKLAAMSPHRAGGIDWMAVTTARMMGWKTESFREKSFLHHRHLGTAERGVLASSFSYGEKDYYLGGHPVWEAISSGLSGDEAALPRRRHGLGAGLLLGFSAPDAAPSLAGTDGVPPQRTDGQAQGHSQNPRDLQTS